jgi:ATP-binding cassette, subfamily B, bacterial MsbA
MRASGGCGHHQNEGWGTHEQFRRTRVSATPSTPGTPARRVFGYLRRHRGSFIICALAFLLASVTEPLIPKLLQVALDEGFVREPTFPLWMVPASLIGLFFVRGVLGFVGQYMLSRGLTRAVLDLRRDLSAALLRADAALFTQVPSGVVVSKMVSDPQAIVAHSGNGMVTLLRDGSTALALLVYLLWLNWQLTLLSFTVFPMLFWGARLVHKRMRKVGADSYAAQNDLAGAAEDLARSWRVIRTFDAQSFEGGRFERLAHAVQKTMLKSAAAAASATPITQTVASLGVALVVTVAMLQVRGGQGTVGSFAGYIAALLLLVSRVRHLSDVSQPLVYSMVVARGCFELMDAPAEPDIGREELKQPAAGGLQFEGVFVRYPQADALALEELSFQARAGQTIAIIGSSGSGKSSIVNALLGFVPLQAGQIRLDGQDIQALTRRSLRRQFAVVSQDVVLFDASLAQNIAYALPLDPVRLAQAVKAAALEDLVASWPQGLDTLIGVNGSKLSGGQRQRVSIARALYKDAPVWIFDEATSALDSESERAIQQALLAWQGRKTMILIAHRLSTVAHADLIVVMDRGRLIEQGTHAELSQRGGAYARALALQTSAASASPTSSPP